MRNALKSLIGDGLFVSDRQIWKSRRSAIGPIIHSRRVKDFVPIMLQVVDEWSKNWESLSEGAEIDMLAEMGQPSEVGKPHSQNAEPERKIPRVAGRHFPTLRQARHLILAWRDDYNHHRLHSSLDGLIPREYHQRSKGGPKLEQSKPIDADSKGTRPPR